MIGDPSGKNTERPELTASIVEENIPKIKNSIRNVFNNHQNIFWDSKKDSEALKPLV